MVSVEGHRMNFFKMIDLIASTNWVTDWLVERPILYKSAMFCIELHVANLEIVTATFTWIGIGDRMFVPCFCIDGANIEHKYSNVEMFICMRDLNSLALNEPRRFRSKNSGYPIPLLWAHIRLSRPAHTRLNPSAATVTQHICCQCHKHITHTHIYISKFSSVQSSNSWNTNKIASLWTSSSMLRDYECRAEQLAQVQIAAGKRMNM